MTMNAQFCRGAYAPGVLRSAPSPIDIPKPKANFGEAPKSTRESACPPQTNAVAAPALSQL
jgi:hypothetical protein